MAAGELRHFSMRLEYDGEAFHGWQRQPGVVATVQGAVEAALSRILGQEVPVRGAGRTDAGVHALDQWVAFSSPGRLGSEELQRALNGVLDPAVWVRELRESSRPLDPLRESIRKTYFYQYHLGVRVPPSRRRTFAPGGRLDPDALRAASPILEGEHDFTSFISEASRYPSCVRRVDRIRVHKLRDGVRIFFTAPGFGYNMVRAMAASLRDVGQGRSSADDLGRILGARDRGAGPAVAPACGLFLFRVDWSDSVTEALESPRCVP